MDSGPHLEPGLHRTGPMRGRILVGMLLVAVVAQASGARAADTAPTLDLRAAIYEDQSKSAVGAVVLEIFLPGMGSVYANDMRGAATALASIAENVRRFTIMIILPVAGFFTLSNAWSENHTSADAK